MFMFSNSRKLAKLLSRLSHIAYSIQYFPTTSTLIVTTSRIRTREVLNILGEYETSVNYKGGLVFIKAKLR